MASFRRLLFGLLLAGSHLALLSCSGSAFGAADQPATGQSTGHGASMAASYAPIESAGMVILGDTVYLSSDAASDSAYSYAMYRLPLGGAAPDRLYVDLFFDIPPVTSGDSAWIGVADYIAGIWEWHGPVNTSPSVIDLGSDKYTSPTDDVVVTVLVNGGRKCHLAGLALNPQILHVGTGQPYTRIEDAYADANDPGGAIILVHPQPGGAPYQQPALQVEKPDIAFRGVVENGARVKLDGTGYNYTGAGPTPRAVFQFNPGADGGSVAGFEIYGASNNTFNGAAVRINQANRVTVRDCEIHACDMGIMSNGSLADNSGLDQVIEFCVIHENGNAQDAGQNHNLYLGGTSVTLRGCEVYGSLTGHNVKSRAHFNQIEYCYVHDSANREFDLVDDANTTVAAGSDSVLIGNIIVKSPSSDNHTVIHFGQDGGNAHQGTLWLVHNTIVTPFVSPVVQLSAAGAGAALFDNIVWDDASRQNNQVLVAVSGGAVVTDVHGGYDWLSHGQTYDPGMLINDGYNYHAAPDEDPPFVDAGNTDPRLRNYRLASADLNLVGTAIRWDTLGLPTGPGQLAMLGLLAYLAPNGLTMRGGGATVPDIGAYEYAP